MYAKNCFALLVASWMFLASVPVVAHEIVAARDLAEIEGRDAATVVATKTLSLCHSSSPASRVEIKLPTPVEGSSTSPAASSTDICPLANALCAACPASTTTITVSSCPSAPAGSRTGEFGSRTEQISSSVLSSQPSSFRPPFSSRSATSSASPAEPRSTPLEPSTRPIRSSTPLIAGSTAPPASGRTSRTLQTLPTGPGAGAGTRASGASSARSGSAITPRAAIPPGIVRRQLMEIMNITAPFANTSRILTNATSTFNVTRILPSTTTTEATGFRFHPRNRV